jgi:hypothetical protein
VRRKARHFQLTMTTPAPPAEFLCPITKKVMKEPVVSRYGIYFEKKAIFEWLNQGYNYCPVTGNPLRPSNLISDKTLEWKIQYWASKNGVTDVLKAEVKEEDEDLLVLGFVAVPPEKLRCALTKEVMKDPVVSKRGHSFERAAIRKWMEEMGARCPITGETLNPSDLISNKKLKWEIQQWQLAYGDGHEEMSRLELDTKLAKAMMVSQDYQMADILKALIAAESEGGKPMAKDEEEDEDVLALLDDVVDTVETRSA